METKLRNKRLDEKEFLKMRAPFLAQWRTGREVDLDEAVEYQKKLPDSKNWHKVAQKLHKEGRTAIFPRAGTGLLEDQISLSRKLVSSGVPFIPVTTDSYTRQLDFEKVEGILEEMRKTGRNLLNGYPIINYGVKQTRKIIESVDRGAFNPRLSLKSYPLATEISFAAGMTGIAASSFISWAAYEKDATLEQSMATNQYVHRLIGYYADRGVTISTDNHGWILTGMQPMTVNLATTIVDALNGRRTGRKEHYVRRSPDGQHGAGPGMDPRDSKINARVSRQARLHGCNDRRRFRAAYASFPHASGDGGRLCVSKLHGGCGRARECGGRFGEDYR